MPVPRRAQVAEQREQAHGFAIRQRRGRLVHQQDARVGAQRARDLDEPLLRHPERSRRRVDVDRGADPRQQRFRALTPHPPVDAPPRAAAFEPQRRDFRRP